MINIAVIDYLNHTKLGKKEIVYPITKENAVYDENNGKLSDKILEMQEKIDLVSTDIHSTINTTISDRSKEDIATKVELQNIVKSYRSDLGISGAGWYRIAQIQDPSTAYMGGGYIVDFDIVTTFNNVINCAIRMELIITYKFNTRFSVLSRNGSSVLSRARIVTENFNTYLEVLYPYNTTNAYHLSIRQPVNTVQHYEAGIFKPIPPIYVSVTDDPNIIAEIDITVNPPAPSNPNILINPDFKINQRGNSSYYCVNYTYTVDRWASHYSTTVNVLDGGVQLSVNNVGGGLYQRIENFEKYRGKTITLSAEISKLEKSTQEGVTLKLVLHDGINGKDVDITDIGTTHVTYTVSGSATRLLAYFLYTKNGATSGADVGKSTIDIKWVKLEVGNTPTKFIPPDETELLRCQRYYAKNPNISVQTSYIYNNVLNTCDIQFPTTMRSAPTIRWLVQKNTIGIHSYNLSFNRNPSNGADNYIAFRSAGSICNKSCMLSFALTNVPEAQHNITIYGGAFEMDAEMY